MIATRRYLPLVLVLPLLGCTPTSQLDPITSVLPANSMAFVAADDPESAQRGNVTLLTVRHVLSVPLGATVRVVEDPGPSTDPRRSVRVHVGADTAVNVNDGAPQPAVTGSIARSALRPAPAP